MKLGELIEHLTEIRAEHGGELVVELPVLGDTAAVDVYVRHHGHNIVIITAEA